MGYPQAGNTTKTMTPKTVNEERWITAGQSGVALNSGSFLNNPPWTIEPQTTQSSPEPDTLGFEEDGEWAAKSKALENDIPEAHTPAPRLDASLYLADRVDRLEEQMDSLLDRLAVYNTRAQHKI